MVGDGGGAGTGVLVLVGEGGLVLGDVRCTVSSVARVRVASEAADSGRSVPRPPAIPATTTTSARTSPPAMAQERVAHARRDPSGAACC